MRFIRIAAFSAAVLILGGAGVNAGGRDGKVVTSPSVRTAFEPNRGQAPAEFEFVTNGFGYSVGLAATHSTLTLLHGANDRTTFSLQFPGARSSNSGEPLGKLDQTSSYLWGNKSFVGIPTFSKVRYPGVWSGIDLLYYGNNRQLEYDFVVAPRGNAGAIRLRFDGIQPARVAANGDLLLATRQGEMTQAAPVAYQMDGSQRKDVAARYRFLKDGTIGIALGKYDKSRELVIDPVLLYTVGGESLSASPYFALTATAVTSDSEGNSYYTGSTPATNTGTGTPYLTTYITKLDNTGKVLASVDLAATDGNTSGTGIGVDSSNNVYVTGSTTSAVGFPNTHGYQLASAGGTDGFLTAIAASFGSVLYSTYIGGTGDETHESLAVTPTGLAFVAGQSTSTNFPVSSAPAAPNGFIVSIDTTKSGSASKIYSVVLGGSGADAAYGVAVDSSNNAYVGGTTASPNFAPTTSGYNEPKSTTATDGFLVKLNPEGAPLWTGFYTAGPINGVSQLNGKAYVVGRSNGTITTTASAYQPATGANHGFFAEFNTAETGSNALVYATNLGGGNQDTAFGVAAAPNGVAFITGATASTNFPIVGSPIIQGTFPVGGIQAAFLSEINPASSGTVSLTYSTLLNLDTNTVGRAVSADLYNEPAVSITDNHAMAGLALKIGSQIWNPTFFVTQQYLDILDRTPDQNGLNYWVGVLTSGQQTRAQVAAAYFTSVEFTSGGLAIIRYYMGAFGSNPDYAGWLNWFTQWHGGLSLTTIENDFVTAPQFTTTYGGLSNSAFVTLAYHNVLNRAPTQTELNNWVTELGNSQVTKAQVMVDLLNSSEAATGLILPRAYANLLYMGYLRRTADPSGLQFWTNSLANLNNLPTVVNNFIISPEYVARFE